jgi:hypothetical protein
MLFPADRTGSYPGVTGTSSYAAAQSLPLLLSVFLSVLLSVLLSRRE